ncbi:mannose-1-phosphate guanylyltransferase [Clostridium fungisolvens]|uniref:mannose-1-phosphate guanylyltransferase n=1 Tax=Clostridium fungisolvens TaxID=1604897 RepID=A0A6V8SBW5_9CLOT|nr:mannose-1-phosphate guanylyltransferase [Clostridium fungisolvens]GFP74196.1 Alginate biosynthesis protein AlgA [Clostridium fungisolvens]
MLCALIMAGGKGTRFWPLSTEEKPKQFLKLLGEETMIQMTVNRIKPLIPLERIFVCTGENYVNLVKSQLPELNERNIIVEPEGRNTAPCMALSAFVISKYYKESTMVVLPSDHLINNDEKFLEVIRDGGEFLNDYPESIITLGMTPDRVEPGYGYIECSNDFIQINNNKAIKVKRFVEKPDKEKAKEYLREGTYLWNGGMFLWKNGFILKLLEENLKTTYEVLKPVENIEEDKLYEYVKENYKLTESISIDYGIMEKSTSIHVIPCDFGWDDIGSWASLERYRSKDNNFNICDNNIKIIDSNNNIGISHKKPIVFYGLEAVFYVETDEVIIITKKEKMNEIKEIKCIMGD